MALINSMIVSAVLLSYGVVLASAKEVHPLHAEGGGADGGPRRKRHLKKGNRLGNRFLTNKIEGKGKNVNNKKNNGSGLDEEDVAFWTRLLQDDRGKGTEIGSLPIVPRPPTPVVRPPVNTPNPIAPIRTPNPTRRPVNTPRPTIRAVGGTSIPVSTPMPTMGADEPETPMPTMAADEPETPTPTYSPTTPKVETGTPTYSPSADDAGGACGLTSTERRSQITGNLGVISLPDLFDQQASPQSQALDWIINDDPSKLCPDDDSLVQRYTLAVFYYSTNGDDWNQCSAPADFDEESIITANAACKLTTSNATTIFPNDLRGTNAWLTSDSECLWGGVSCYSSDTPSEFQVNVVEFENNGLSGTLPTEMEELSNMRFFALERGSISGPIPSSYGNLKKLLLLDFDFNNLDGTLPDTLYELVNLRQLDLNDNNLEGEVSDEIGQMKQLRFFQIDNNSMEGTIPSALGDIPNFSLIGLSGNNFEGAMPSEVCDLRPSPLQTLVVDCDIECDIPECCTSCVPV